MRHIERLESRRHLSTVVNHFGLGHSETNLAAQSGAVYFSVDHTQAFSITNLSGADETFQVGTQIAIGDSGNTLVYFYSLNLPVTVGAGDTFSQTLIAPTSDNFDPGSLAIVAGGSGRITVDSSIDETSGGAFSASSDTAVTVTYHDSAPVVSPPPVLKLNPHGKIVGKNHNELAVLLA